MERATIPKETVHDLLEQLDATKGAKSTCEVSQIADREVGKAKDFVENFESSSGRAVPNAQRCDLARHLWDDHVEAARCESCPYQAALSPWYSSVCQTRYWPDWQSLNRSNPKKTPRWSAEKKLSIYLSLQQCGFRSHKPLARKVLGSRLILSEGNNRITMLAALGRLNDQVDVR